MREVDAYGKGIYRILERIIAYSPKNLVDLFSAESGLGPASYAACGTGFEGSIAAVDGSNAIVLDAGSYAVAAVRAGESTFREGTRLHRGITSPCLAAIGPERKCEEFVKLYRRCFQTIPETPLYSDDPVQASAVLRDTLEYSVARRLADTLDAGDLLLLDGALTASHASHQPVILDLLKRCRRRGVLLAAVTKRSSVTWGNGYPLVPAAAGLADRCGIDHPWYVGIPDSLLEAPRFKEWQQGAIFVARLHPRACRAFKVELPRYAQPEAIERTFAALARYSDDGRIAGYPVPLMEAHRLVKIDRDLVEQMRQDLIGAMSGAGMRIEDYLTMFGDIHDEFERY
ncbi:MAG: DNA double-strand break repair nuclease NurA [Methanomicrobiales archaeon]|nr:DNA double-strand break repair nuclease NurA [Methanomicrobiales archaeon]MDI6877439.1 DNA double-strand break repair nuclease NurA [Methanomicrobiales archaeon]